MVLIWDRRGALWQLPPPALERNNLFGELRLDKQNHKLIFMGIKHSKICKLVLSVSTLGSTLVFLVYCPFYTKLNASHMQLETTQIMNVRTI